MQETAGYKNLYKKLIKRYVVFALILLVFLVAKQAVIQYMIYQEEDTTKIMNIAGRQRMLSQKLAKDILVIEYFLSDYEEEKAGNSNQRSLEEEAKFYRKDLEQALTIFMSVHSDLINGNDKNGVPYKPSEIVGHMLSETEPSYGNIVSIAQKSIEDFDRMQAGEKIQEESGYYTNHEVFMFSEASYLKWMEEIVDQYELETNRRIRLIETIEILMFSALLLLVIVITFFVFIPIAKELKKTLWEANEGNDNIMKFFYNARGALVMTRHDGRVIIMNQDAKKLIQPSKGLEDGFHIEDDIHWTTNEMTRMLEKLQTEERIEDVEIEFEKNEKETRKVIVSATRGVFQSENAILFTIHDVTAQKEADLALKNLAECDELTGLYNRHFLDTIIEEEISRAERYEIPLSSILLDLDHFKNINDRWGHPVGDSVLKMTARLLKENSRTSDFAIRIGGEEFVVLLPHTDIIGARTFAEKIRTEIEAGMHPVAGKFTASFGIAQRNPGETYRSLYKRMDDALYQAKQAGRNCVMNASDEINVYNVTMLKWNKNWNCRESKIDKQHKELFELASCFMNISMDTISKEQAKEYLESMMEQLKAHFAYEELMLEKYDFDQLHMHKMIHEKLYARGQQIKDNVIDGVTEFSQATVFMFDEIIIGHLLSEDVKFFQLF